MMCFDHASKPQFKSLERRARLVLDNLEDLLELLHLVRLRLRLRLRLIGLGLGLG